MLLMLRCCCSPALADDDCVAVTATEGGGDVRADVGVALLIPGHSSSSSRTGGQRQAHTGRVGGQLASEQNVQPIAREHTAPPPPPPHKPLATPPHAVPPCPAAHSLTQQGATTHCGDLQPLLLLLLPCIDCCWYCTGSVKPTAPTPSRAAPGCALLLWCSTVAGGRPGSPGTDFVPLSVNAGPHTLQHSAAALLVRDHHSALTPLADVPAAAAACVVSQLLRRQYAAAAAEGDALMHSILTVPGTGAPHPLSCAPCNADCQSRGPPRLHW